MCCALPQERPYPGFGSLAQLNADLKALGTAIFDEFIEDPAPPVGAIIKPRCVVCGAYPCRCLEKFGA